MNAVLLAPPIVFIIYLALLLGFSRLSGIFAAKGVDAPGKTKSYACGEAVPHNSGQPEYEQFFQFAFFFTVMHVAVLIIASVPSGISVLPVLYLLAAVLALLILFRR